MMILAIAFVTSTGLIGLYKNEYDAREPPKRDKMTTRDNVK